MIPCWAWGRSSTEDLFLLQGKIPDYLRNISVKYRPIRLVNFSTKGGISSFPQCPIFQSTIVLRSVPSYCKEPWAFVIEFTPQSRLRSFLEQTNNTHGSKSYTILPSSADATRGNSREPVEVAVAFCLLLNHCLSSHLSCFHQCLETEAWEWLPTRKPLGLSQLETL